LEKISAKACDHSVELRNPTIQTYDMMDRVVLTTLPAATGTERPAQTTSYAITDNRRTTTTTDPLGNRSVQTVDGRGNIISVHRFAKDATNPSTWATYAYNGIGEMLSATDAEGNRLEMTYDRLGRRTRMTSADIGTKEWQYDRAGNVIVERDSELTHRGSQIRYVYDSMNRLTEIIYPFSENTRYEYGAPNAPRNSRGRVTKILDETGSMEYTYGELGQVLTETREIKQLPLSRGQTRTATMRYTSDYLGRMQEIVYPDGETVTYSYNYGGEIKSVTGVRQGTTFNYVRNIGYDEFNQRVFIEYGSNVRTTYEYDQYRRWLSGIRTTDNGNNLIQDITYKFNEVGNVLGYRNNAHRHTTTQDYEYDELYQLVSASGTSVSHPFGGNMEYNASYTQNFTFDKIGNMQTKVSLGETSNGAIIGDNLNYNMSYIYYAGTHKAERIGNRFYTYDLNGNLIAEREGGHATNTETYRPYYRDGDIYWTEYGFGVVRPELATPQDGTYQRNYKWNERNLLSESSDSAYTVQYRYGADGQRAIKYVLNTGRSTLYFNRMWQVNDSREAAVQSKHIYVGETRIATKNNSENNQNTLAEAERTYYYHSDHLGSAQTVTNHRGNVHERLEYTPYGELWINWKNSADSDTTPFRFTGKELDEETNLYYYGARYLDPRTSRWIAGDPAIWQGDYIPVAPVNDEARKHNQNLPGMGGIFNTVNMHAYHYAGNNPVKYVDPTGREIDAFFVITHYERTEDGITAHGILTVTCRDSGEIISTPAFTGGVGRDLRDGVSLPLPLGEYKILDRAGKTDRYRLEPMDYNPGNDIADGLFPVQEEMRLHGYGTGQTFGCLSVINDSDFNDINIMLQNTSKSTMNVYSRYRNPIKRLLNPVETLTQYGTLTISTLDRTIFHPTLLR